MNIKQNLKAIYVILLHKYELSQLPLSMRVGSIVIGRMCVYGFFFLPLQQNWIHLDAMRPYSTAEHYANVPPKIYGQ